MKEERFPRTRKSLRGQRLQVAEGGSFRATEESTTTGVRRAKRKRFPHGGSAPTSTHQPERLVCSPAGAGGCWELRLGLRSDRSERTGVGGMNTV